MEIKYLNQLQNNPYRFPDNKENPKAIKGISEVEITHLELLYNNGRAFPKVLKELLYLAGESCYVLDRGPFDTQEELQEFVREILEDLNRVITRPFYIIDSTAGTYLFIYLDEGDNPNYNLMPIYESDDSKWIVKWHKTIQELVNDSVENVKKGRTPF